MVTFRHCHGPTGVVSQQRCTVMSHRARAGTVYSCISKSVHVEHMHRLRSIRKCVFRTTILVGNSRTSIQSTCADMYRAFSLKFVTISLLMLKYAMCFQDIQDSCEPSIFSFERLLFNIINDTRSHIDILKQVKLKIYNITGL